MWPRGCNEDGEALSQLSLRRYLQPVSGFSTICRRTRPRSIFRNETIRFVSIISGGEMQYRGVTSVSAGELKMDLGLKNETALVIAGTRGLGLACARVLVAEGAHFVINGRNVERGQAAE